MPKDSFSESYRKAGVDVTAGYETVSRIRPMVESTYIPGVIGSIGGFGGLFRPEFAGMEDPILVSGTDGVGTKLKIAFALNVHNTVGIDCVAMCVNDIVCCGARPLFFLDYLAVGKLDPSVAEQIVSGVAEGCRMGGCALIGGETAEMPGFYPVGEYDLAGFSVGIVDRKKMIDGSAIVPGDVLIGIASSGLHSNGFSLARKVLGDTPEKLSRLMENGQTVGSAMLAPTRIYVKPILKLMEDVCVKGVSNITGGGFYENVPRMLPAGVRASIEKALIPQTPLFKLLQREGDIPERDMYNTFNMGVGMVVAVSAADEEKAIGSLRASGERAFRIGTVVSGETGVDVK